MNNGNRYEQVLPLKGAHVMNYLCPFTIHPIKGCAPVYYYYSYITVTISNFTIISTFIISDFVISISAFTAAICIYYTSVGQLSWSTLWSTGQLVKVFKTVYTLLK